MAVRWVVNSVKKVDLSFKNNFTQKITSHKQLHTTKDEVIEVTDLMAGNWAELRAEMWAALWAALRAEQKAPSTAQHWAVM